LVFSLHAHRFLITPQPEVSGSVAWVVLGCDSAHIASLEIAFVSGSEISLGVAQAEVSFNEFFATVAASFNAHVRACET
jgi:hypothetical protein